MSVEILGRREDLHLELKSKRALDQPDGIAREVVGMLNADGGEVWIGVEEEGGRAVAVDPVPGPQGAVQRLLDHLVDRLEPSPTHDEVSVEPTPAGADPALLVIEVTPQGDRKPYALLGRGGARHFLRRVGARNLPMPRHELFGPKDPESTAEEAIRKLEKARESLPDRSGLWLALQPERTLTIDPEDERITDIALDPSLTGNRRTGWHFARSSRQPRPAKGRLEWSLESELSGDTDSRVTVMEGGGAQFWAAPERLHWKGEEHEIWPLALLEYAVSAFRIAHVLYQEHLGPEDRMVADLALLGVGGWGLRAGTPGDFFSSGELRKQDEPDLIWKPRFFFFREISEAPDECGFRLVRRVYHAFGFRETDMPRQYDRRRRKLILPE